MPYLYNLKDSSSEISSCSNFAMVSSSFPNVCSSVTSFAIPILLFIVAARQLLRVKSLRRTCTERNFHSKKLPSKFLSCVFSTLLIVAARQLLRVKSLRRTYTERNFHSKKLPSKFLSCVFSTLLIVAARQLLRVKSIFQKHLTFLSWIKASRISLTSAPITPFFTKICTLSPKFVR